MEGHTYRLATDAAGNHGYEIGYFPVGVDITNPAQFLVVETVYDQVEAAARAVALNGEAQPKAITAPAPMSSF